MVTTEFEEELKQYKDAELLRCAAKYLKLAYLEMTQPSGDDEAQEYLDFIYMECVHRRKEWIFDKAQEACIRESNLICRVPARDAEPA